MQWIILYQEIKMNLKFITLVVKILLKIIYKIFDRISTNITLFELKIL